eukprot:7391881-Prymnesium_polylepis.2
MDVRDVAVWCGVGWGLSKSANAVAMRAAASAAAHLSWFVVSRVCESAGCVGGASVAPVHAAAMGAWRWSPCRRLLVVSCEWLARGVFAWVAGLVEKRLVEEHFEEIHVWQCEGRCGRAGVLSAVWGVEATDVSLFVEVLADGVPHGVGVVLIYAAGCVMVHELLTNVGTAIDDGLGVAHDLDGWGVA